MYTDSYKPWLFLAHSTFLKLPYYSQLSFFLIQSCVFFFYTCHKICNEGYHFQYCVSLIRHHPQIVATQSRAPSEATLE